MRRIKSILLGGEGLSPWENRLHQLYILLALTGFGLLNGFLALRLAACSYAPLYHPAVYASYFDHDPIVALNILPAVLLALLGYFLFRRAWAGYLCSAVPTLGLALANYYKIQLRGDPLLASDLRLIRTAGGILSHYTPDLSRVVLVACGGGFLMLLFSIFLLRNGLKNRWVRLGGLLVCLALVPLLGPRYYLSDEVYDRTANYDAIHNRWSDVELFVSRGFWYPFLRSVPDAFPSPPAGYDARSARAFLDRYEDADIPEDGRVTVVGVMLEAFCDLTDYPMLSSLPAVQSLYEPLHALEAESVSGDLLTNIFAGGTVDSEWGFLTGYSRHSDFRTDTDSYVRYFSAQGYETVYQHPGYGWFYNRQNVNRYLGFDGSVFTDNGFGRLVSPEQAPFHSDAVLFKYLLDSLDARGADAPPLFSFSVSYQNHGPYSAERKDLQVLDASTGWSAETNSILDVYLSGVSETITELVKFKEALDRLDTPVVLVVFGDHKPWLGNDNSVYQELGVNLDISSVEGFRNYYATPYLIWANGAAKAETGASFTGAGRDCSPCFLMPELFDLLGWEGPRFMALSRDMRSCTPLLHERELFLSDGVLTDTLSPEAEAFYRQFLCAQYWRETKGLT